MLIGFVQGLLLLQVDEETMDMLKAMNMSKLPGVKVQQVRLFLVTWFLPLIALISGASDKIDTVGHRAVVFHCEAKRDEYDLPREIKASDNILIAWLCASQRLGSFWKTISKSRQVPVILWSVLNVSLCTNGSNDRDTDNCWGQLLESLVSLTQKNHKCCRTLILLSS